MHLGKLYSNFDSRCKSYFARIREINGKVSTNNEWEINYLTEVLISDIWQAWGNFCRELYFSSCRGTRSRDGGIILGMPGNHSWQRISYEARQAAFGQNTTVAGHQNFPMRKEPTWGDVDVFIKIVNAIQPSNSVTLLSIFGSFTDIKHIRRVRNACAHKNVESIGDISMLASNYSFPKLSYATDMAWKIKPGDADFAIEIWLFEMNLIADHATSTP